MSVEIALQKHVVAALKASSAVTALVAAAEIADDHGKPERFPAIRVGEMASDPADLDNSFHDEVAFDLVIWSATPGTGEAKTIAAAIREALPVGMWKVAGLRYVRATLSRQLVSRDPVKDNVKAVLAFDVVAR